MIDIQRNRNNKKLINAVNFLQLEFPVKEISEKLGVDKGNVSSYLSNKKTVSSKFLEKFAEAFSLNLEDFKDVDEKFLERKNRLEDLVSQTNSTSEIIGYYYPEVSASAGLDTQMNNDELKKIPVTIPGWEKDIIFINVYGDSMYPKYNAGEIIGVKPIEFQYINYGYPYVVVFNNGDVYIKIAQPGKDDEHLILESVNTFYKPKEHHLDQIKGFYSVKGVIKKEMM